MRKIIILFILIVTFHAYILNKHETKTTSTIDNTLLVKTTSILENNLSELNALSGNHNHGSPDKVVLKLS